VVLLSPSKNMTVSRHRPLPLPPTFSQIHHPAIQRYKILVPDDIDKLQINIIIIII
jgi:hypothetical protein